MTGNTAIFFDIENITMYFAKRHKRTPNIQDMYLRINELEGVNGIAIQRAYADWSVPAVREVRQFIIENGIESVQVFNSNYNDLIKNASDVYLIIDAVEVLLTKPEIEFFVIVSGDGIFSFLAKKIHEYGKKVIGCGYTPMMNQLLKRSVDDYIELEVPGLQAQPTVEQTSASVAVEATVAIEENTAAVETVARPTEATAKAKTQAQAQTQAQTKKRVVKATDIPKNKISNSLNAAGIAVLGQNPTPIEIFRKIKEILLGIYRAEGNENGELDVSIFKMYIDHYIPGFRSTQFQYKRFIDFLRYIFTGTPYCLYAYRPSLFRIIKRKMVVPSKKVLEDIEGFSVLLEDRSLAYSLMDIPLEGETIAEPEDGRDVIVEYTVVKPEDVEESPDHISADESPIAEPENDKETDDGIAAGESIAEGVPENDKTVGKVVAAETVEEGKTVDIPATGLVIDEKMVEEPITINPPEDGKAADKSVASVQEIGDKAAEIPIAAGSLSEEKTESREPVKTVENKRHKRSDKKPAEVPAASATVSAGNTQEMPLRQLVKETISRLIDKKKLTQKELNKLQTAEYGKETFNINYPLLREVNEEQPLRPQRVVDGKARYWREVYEIKNKKYIVYQDWSEKKNRRLFVAWMERLK